MREQAGLLACASSFCRAFPRSHAVACVGSRPHLQLRGQLQFFTGFPIKP